MAMIEFGALHGGIYNYSDASTKRFVESPIYSSVNAQYGNEVIYIEGGMDCYFTARAIDKYDPFQMTYRIGAGVNLGNIRLGYEHSCFHPMQPYATIFGSEIKPKYEGGYDRFFVRISTN